MGTLEVDHAVQDDYLDLDAVCGTIEEQLKNRGFIVGLRVSIADIAAVCSLRESLEKAGYDSLSSKYPNTCKWMQSCMAALQLGSPASAARSVSSTCPPPPRHAYSDAADGSPAGVYWMWFRRGLATRLRAAGASGACSNAQEALLKDATAAGICRTCAEVFRRPLSENEIAHLKQVPVTAEWIRKLLA